MKRSERYYCLIPGRSTLWSKRLRSQLIMEGLLAMKRRQLGLSLTPFDLTIYFMFPQRMLKHTEVLKCRGCVQRNNFRTVRRKSSHGSANKHYACCYSGQACLPSVLIGSASRESKGCTSHVRSPSNCCQEPFLSEAVCMPPSAHQVVLLRKRLCTAIPPRYSLGFFLRAKGAYCV